jgi:hypothetical protein
MTYIRTNDILYLSHADPRSFVSLEKVYLGVAAAESLQNLKHEVKDRQSITQFLKTCLTFYVELLTQIKQRFDFKDEIYTFIEIVDPVKAQKYEIKSLRPVLMQYPILKDFVDEQQLDNEWKQHALFDFKEFGLDKNHTAEKYWQDVFSLTNAAGIPMFKHLEVVMHYFLLLPFSNASVERLFSDLNNIKTNNRNCLNTENIASLIYSKQGIEKCNGLLSFESSKKMLKCNIWSKNK